MLDIRFFAGFCAGILMMLAVAWTLGREEAPSVAPAPPAEQQPAYTDGIPLPLEAKGGVDVPIVIGNLGYWTIYARPRGRG